MINENVWKSNQKLYIEDCFDNGVVMIMSTGVVCSNRACAHMCTCTHAVHMRLLGAWTLHFEV